MARHGRSARWASTTMLAAIMGMAASAAFARSTPAPAPAPPPTAPAPDAQRPNILFGPIDDLPSDDLSILGKTQLPTTNPHNTARESAQITQTTPAYPDLSWRRHGSLPAGFQSEAGVRT